MKLNSFDIEIAKEVSFGDQDLTEQMPLGITCAASTLYDDWNKSLVWYAGMRNEAADFRNLGDISAFAASSMTPIEAQKVVKDLLEYNAAGYVPLTWNGLHFDFVVLAHESGLFEECRHLALNHYDLMFQFFCRKGFFLGLNKALLGMGLAGKTEGMSGELAPQYWREGRYGEVLEYVVNDTTEPIELVKKLEAHRFELDWISSRGKRMTDYLGPLLTVNQCLDLPQPDTSWMSDPVPREHFFRFWNENQG